MINDIVLIAAASFSFVFAFFAAVAVGTVIVDHPYLFTGLVITGGFVVAMGWPRKL